MGQLLCLDCVVDDSLRALLVEDATAVRCSYCERDGLGAGIREVAELVDKPLRAYAAQAGYEMFFPEDSDGPGFEQRGDQLEFFLQEELGTSDTVARDLASELVDLDPADPRDGEEPFYDRDANYERRAADSLQFRSLWNSFAQRIKHERRFFDTDARGLLSKILGEERDALPTIAVGPRTPLDTIWRARRVRNEQQREQILRQPEKELGPPPPEFAKPQRMNPAGIPVFYGAFSEATAVAELRPDVGSEVVIAQFALDAPLLLLDLPLMASQPSGSIFHPDYQTRANRTAFLKSFHLLIARPIGRDDELIDYIPTQAVAEYVASVLHLDGILYASAQAGAASDPKLLDRPWGAQEPDFSRYNVVLFQTSHATSLSDSDVASRAVPPLWRLRTFEPHWIWRVSYSHSRVPEEE